jgi:subtilisin family serine protease
MPNKLTKSPRRAKPNPWLPALIVLATAALCLSLFPVQPLASPVVAQTPPQHLLVKFAPQASSTPERALSGLKLDRWVPLPIPGWVRVTLAPDHAATLAALYADPAVQAIEEDHRVRLDLTPNDTLWEAQWGPALIHAPEAWATNTGSPDVIVAVLDTGIERQHSELAGQLWVNPDEIPDNHLDDDSNGYVDDIHGWNVLGEGSAAIDDDYGHGTHVSGIIAARGNNGQGIAGMAWSSRLMVVKVLDENGDGTYSGLATALAYAADNGARVANLSLGGPEPSQILKEAVDYARARRMLVVASSGNTNSAIQFPAAYDHALAVAASTRYDDRASYSCYGPEADLTAPGSAILSTCMGDDYCYKSGTSMAAPHVAGLAALLFAQEPTLSPAQVAQIMQETARDMDEPGWDPYTGWGRIDAYRALARFQTQFRYYFPMIQVNRLEEGASIVRTRGRQD